MERINGKLRAKIYGMGNRMHTKMHTNGFPPKWGIPQTVGITGMAGVAQLVELWIVIPMLPSDISDLTPKPPCGQLRTNA